MKRQDTVMSSSSYRENPSENLHAKSIGCMSGIIHLVCKYQSRRKFLTFGKKQEKNEVLSATKSKPVATTEANSPSAKEQSKKEKNGTNSVDLQRFSCEVPRSPTLPAEMRRSNSVNSAQNFRAQSPALMARLMGLEEAPEMQESSAEKRTKLLRALEKCNQDLNALKNIIESVRVSEQVRSTATVKSVAVEAEIRRVKRCSEFSGEKQQPSPVSVLDELTRSPLSGSNPYSRQHYTNGRVQVQQKQQLKKKPGEEEITNTYFYDRITATTTDSVQTKGDEDVESSPTWSSKAMKESVEEVCQDIARGEKREVGRIGLALQDHICRDLIEEIVTEMGCCAVYTLPFEACKRRLCF